MSKTVKQAIMRDYTSRLTDPATSKVREAMLISVRALKGTDNTKVRLGLAKKKIKVSVIRNSLARKNFAGTPLAPLADFLTGPSALVYGGASVVECAREVVGLIAKFPGIELKGAVLDGQLYSGKAGVEELSKLPTREEAVANVVTLIVSPAKKLMGQIKGPGSNIAGIIKAIETKLEKGETIAKVG